MTEPLLSAVRHILVEEQRGNAVYDIIGFRRIEINDEMVYVKFANPVQECPSMYSIRVHFQFTGMDDQSVVLGRYNSYIDAKEAYRRLVCDIADGKVFISMAPDENRELQERGEVQPEW